MDYRSLKSKIRHFLLQQDPAYIEALHSNKPLPPVLAIAKSLDQSCAIGVRRLQKYLTDGDNAKDLSITVEDLLAFAALANQNMCTFVAYLFSEEVDCQLSSFQRTIIKFFEKVHLGLRRELSHSIFASGDLPRNEELLGLLLKLSQLSASDLKVAARVIDSLPASRREAPPLSLSAQSSSAPRLVY
jgi:hypothetical protein